MPATPLGDPADAMHALTVDPLKARKQVGRTIGAFQGLQHRGVDMFVALEQAHSMAMFAAMTMEYRVGHYFKRMTMTERMFGDAEHHLSRVAALGGAF